MRKQSVSSGIKMSLLLLVVLGVMLTANISQAETIITDNKNYELRLPNGWEIADKDTNTVINVFYGSEYNSNQEIAVGYSFELVHPPKGHSAVGYISIVPLEKYLQTRMEIQGTMINTLVGVHNGLSTNPIASLVKAELTKDYLYTILKIVVPGNEILDKTVSSRNVLWYPYKNIIICVVIILNGDDVENLYPLVDDFRNALTLTPS